MIEVTTQEIALRSLDKDFVEDIEDNSDAVRFRVLLSETPTQEWINEYELVYARMPHVIKPPTQVSGDAILIDYLPLYTAELSAYLRFLDSAVHGTNQELRRSYELDTAQDQNSRKAKFRETLRGLGLP